jgi:tetratricopeptide (TPR) repeat protein
MRNLKSFSCLVSVAVAVGWLTVSAVLVRAAEPAWDFLEGLRQRGYHDMALAYLDQMRTSPRCPEDLKEVVDYQVGVTLVATARTGTIEFREGQLDQASARLNQFIKDRPDHDLAAAANTQLANVLVERGRIKTELASRSSKSAAEKKALMAEARAQFEKAQKVFESAEEHYYERAKNLKESADPTKVPNLEEAQQEAYRDLVQARLFLAGVIYEVGKTYDPKSKEYKEKLTEAAKQYGELYEKYGSYVGGLYARMWEGRTYKELGEPDKAINIFKEMMTLPADAPVFRTLISQSLALALETYLLPDVKNYAEAVKTVTAWEEKARPDEMSTPEGLKVLYLGGRASMELAKTLEDEKERRGNRNAARQRLERVSRFIGEHRRDAMMLLQDPFFGQAEEVPDEDLGYLEAKDKGDFGWGTFVVVMGKLQSAKTDDEQKELSSQLNEARDQATKYYKMALGLADAEVSKDELNLLRFRLTYLYFVAQDYHRAAVMGEFLARRQPTSVGARKGAEIAVKAYRVLFTQASPQEDRSFEMERMTGIANYVTARWQGEPEADEAWMMLTDTAVDLRELDKAIEYLGNISEESSLRAQAELRAGQALWAGYVRESSKEESSRLPQSDLDAMVAKAQETLEQGIGRMLAAVEGGAPVEYSLAQSVLSLAQILVGQGEAEKSAEWLDKPKVGPMTLVKAESPVAKRGNFVEDTYKTALRAYVGAQKLDQAEEVMNALEEIAADTRRLTQIYIALGRELQEQLERLGKEGKEEERKKVSGGFEVFLGRILNRQEGNTFSSLNWVAETYMGLGDGLAAGRADPPDEAIGYYGSAVKAYATILKRIKEKDPELNAPAGAETTIMVRLAACLRKLGKYEESKKILLKILREREKRVDVQVEAAKTYQAWGSERPGYYKLAILGGGEDEETGRRLIWGWAGIANRVAAFDQYQGIFHEARYNLALCRTKLAGTQKGDEREGTLKQAELDITRIQRLYPEMGGEKWYDKYDDLLKNIQKLLRKKATGLEGLKEKD